MSDPDNFKEGEFHGRVLGELDLLKSGQVGLHTSIDKLSISLDSFKCGMGERVGNNEKKIVVMEKSTDIMARVMWVVVAAILTAVVGGVLKMVIR